MSTRFPNKFLSDYKRIGELRGFQEAIADAYHLQMMRCPVHLSIGQEYWLPPIQRLVHKSVRCFSSHRSHSMYMALGGDFLKMIAELHGDEEGALLGRGGSMHLKDLAVGLEHSVPIVGSSIGLSLGSALASQKLNQNTQTLAYFGDGACEEGILHESLNMARIYNLPILFLCENNMYSCSTHIRRRQPLSSMYRFAHAHDIRHDVIHMDMNFDQIVHKIDNALSLSLQEPFFLEVNSYRLYQHCGDSIDMNIGDRTQAEYEDKALADCFVNLCNEYSSVEDSYLAAKTYYSGLIELYTSKNTTLINS